MKDYEKMDLQVDGPYSPISIKKVSDSGILQLEGFNVLIPGTNEQLGVVADDPERVNVMITDRIMQAEYFIDEIFPNLPRIPAYLYRYIHYMMFSEESNFKYPTDADYIYAIESDTLKMHEEEYQKVHNFIKWGKTNTEAVHLIGLLQLVGGSLKAAAKNNSGLKMFIELPETGFHPKREGKIMSMLNKLKDEYGYNKGTKSE